MAAKRKYTIRDWEAVRRALAGGASVRAAAAMAGVDRGAVWRWRGESRPPERILAMMVPEVDAAAAPPVRKSPKARLTAEERAWIAAMRDAGATCAAIAARIGVHRTTVSRELARCGGRAYDPRRAQLEAYNLSRRPKARKLDSDPALRREVVARLGRFFSPREVAESLKRDFPGDGSMRISHEAIYQAIYVQGKGSLRQELAVEKALRRGGTRRRPRSQLPPRPRGKSWVEGCEISERPPEAADRAVPGHWEGDLIVGSDMRSCLVLMPI